MYAAGRLRRDQRVRVCESALGRHWRRHSGGGCLRPVQRVSGGLPEYPAHGGDSDPLVCWTGDRPAALQQRYRVCACSFFPVLWFLYRISADADPDRGDLRSDHVADLEIYGAGDFCTECGYQ